MEYADGKVKDLQIAYIGGGSRGWAWTFMTDLAMDEELSGTIRLYDIDAEAAKHNEIIGNRLSAREDVVGKWNYTVSDSLQSALTGADFIVISILPGTFDEMAVDVHMPERLGICRRYRRPRRCHESTAYNSHVCGDRTGHQGICTESLGH